MTITFLRAYSGWSAGQVTTLDRDTEAALVQQGIASVSGVLPSPISPPYPSAKANRQSIAVGILGQSNERGQVSPGEAIGGVPSSAAYPQAFASARNPAMRYPIAPAQSLFGGMWFKLYDDLYDAGFLPTIINGAIGSLSLLYDLTGRIHDRNAAYMNNYAARAQRAPIGQLDRGFAGDYMTASNRLFLCTTGRSAYCMSGFTALPGDTGVTNTLDYTRLVGTQTTAGASPDFSTAVVGQTVADGSVVWTCVATAFPYLGFNYTAGQACSETRVGFDPYGILHRMVEDMGRVPSAIERIILIQNAQSDFGLTSSEYQGAINNAATFLLVRGFKVAVGLSFYQPTGANTGGYDTLSSAVAASTAFLRGVNDGFGVPYGARVIDGANLYRLLGSSGATGAGGGFFAKDSGQDNLHVNAAGALAGGGAWSNALLAALPRQAA